MTQLLSLTDEREKRKDQILALQKSKHERLESELSTLQQVYGRIMGVTGSIPSTIKSMLLSFENNFAKPSDSDIRYDLV